MEDVTAMVKRGLAGDREALGWLVERHAGLVHAALRAHMPAGEAADDLVQETFLRAFRNFRTLREPGSFPAWLCGIARRVAVDALRRRGRRPAVALDAAGEPAAPEGPAPDPDGSPAAILSREIDALPEPLRLTVILHYRNGMAYAEIARALGLSRAAVNARLARAREILRRKLARAFRGIGTDELP